MMNKIVRQPHMYRKLTIAALCLCLASCTGVPLQALEPFPRPPGFVDANNGTGAVTEVPAGRALFFYLAGDRAGNSRIFNINNVFSIDIPWEEYVTVELDPGEIDADFQQPDPKIKLGSGKYEIHTRYSLYAGEKLYINEHYGYRDTTGKFLDQFQKPELDRLERWKKPIAYIKLCNNNSRVCDDSPWKPQPMSPAAAVAPPVDSR